VSEDRSTVAQAAASLPAEQRSVSVARHVLRDLLERCDIRGEQRRDALLVATELVANAVNHGSHSGDEIDVEFSVERRRVCICVRDRARGRSAPLALTPDESRAAGRGLQIVQQLADWSERIVDGRREVRAELT
jgi:anti-sigma regulatory factor (Ser/Thr protein kinase)